MSAGGRELFAAGVDPREVMYQAPDRPLGPVSDFVRGALPHKAAGVRSGELDVRFLIHETDTIVGNLSRDFVDEILAEKGATGIGGHYPFSHRKDLAGLDLKVIEAAIVHNGGVPLPALTELVDRFSAATDQPEVITYEEIIYVNPQADMRTFTTYEDGNAELDFYYGHRRIEGRLENVIRGIEFAGYCLREDEGKVEKAGSELQAVIPDFKAAMDDLKAIGFVMEEERFEAFRGYLMSHPMRGIPEDAPTRELLIPGEQIPQEHYDYLKENKIASLKGPSGAFTATLPVIEMLLVGEQLPPFYEGYIERNMRYFPRNGREKIKRAREIVSSAHTISKLGEQVGNPESLRRGIHGMLRIIYDFRSAHMGAVAHQIPDVMKGEDAGTAGEANVRGFLDQRRQMTRGLMKDYRE